MNLRVQALTFVLGCAALVGAGSKEETISVQGVVVSVQRGEKDTRVTDPPSFADLAEIYVMRVEHWTQPHKEKYILVEYIHQGDLIAYDRFDSTAWKFELDQPSPRDNDDCHSWMARSKFTFLPTAFGSKEDLPDPKELRCFLTTKAPVPVSHKPTTH